MEKALEEQWRGINEALGPFLRGESTDTVFVTEQLHPVTIQRLQDTHQLRISRWMGLHSIKRIYTKPCNNRHTGECLLKCKCE